ncbi:MAG: hypothetical protein AAF529_23255, partial [Pseudomonadota bacterium]
MDSNQPYSRTPAQRTQPKGILATLPLLLCVGFSMFYAPAVSARWDCSVKLNLEYQQCWYVQVGVGGSHVAPESIGNGWTATNKQSSGWKITGGWRFHPQGFVELSYADLGQAEIGNQSGAVGAQFPNANISYQVPSLMVGYWLR